MRSVYGLALICLLCACETAPVEEPVDSGPVLYEGRELSAWLGDLDGASVDAQERASVVLGRIGAPAVDGLRERLAPERPLNTKLAATRALGLVGMDAAPACPELAAQLAPDCPLELRTQSARALFLLGPGAIDATEALVPLLESEHWQDRYHAATALGNSDGPAKLALSRLKELARRDLDRRVRDGAALAVDRLLGEAPRTWTPVEPR